MDGVAREPNAPRAPSTGALAELEAELAEVEAVLEAIDSRPVDPPTSDPPSGPAPGETGG